MHSPLPILATLVVAALPIQAQQRPQPLPDGSAVGASAGVFTGGGESIFALSLTASELRSGGGSVDFSLALSPQALAYGALLLAADLGLAYNVALPGVTVLLKGGPSLVAGAGGDGAAAFGGVHAGVGAVFRVGPRAGLRVDLVEHLYFSGGEGASVPSLMVGFTAVPRG